MPDTIMFMFGGRRANVELQLPFIRRILEENPDVEYHLWNLARDPADREWLRCGLEGLMDPRRFHVRNEFAGDNPWERFTNVYESYTHEHFKGCVFVKLDDDVVFIESDRFRHFVDGVWVDPSRVHSAQVVNNGACARTHPGLWGVFNGLKPRPRLLDVHMKPAFATASHEYFFDHPEELLGQSMEWKPIQDWLSINLIGYDWEMGRRIHDLLGTRPPRMIAGRKYTVRDRVGDEGAVNMLPRIVMQGFTAGHLYFGPQARKMPDDLLDRLRKGYAEIGREYLGE